jgi:hypothetical protein
MQRFISRGDSFLLKSEVYCINNLAYTGPGVNDIETGFHTTEELLERKSSRSGLEIEIRP